MIVVSLTSIPSRLKLLWNFFNSIQKQTLQPDVIYVQIPKVSRKGIPYDLEILGKTVKMFNKLNIKINVLPIDYGPITKLYPLFDLVEDPNASLILMDDDVQYSNNTIETLVKNGNLEACGFVGLIKKDDKLVWRHKGTVSFLETYHGVLYKRYLFPKNSNKFINWYLQKIKEEPICANTDDIIIGAWVHKKGYKLNIIEDSNVKVVHNPGGTEELRNTNLKDGNMICYNYIFAVDNKHYYDLIILGLVLIMVGMIIYLRKVFF